MSDDRDIGSDPISPDGIPISIGKGSTRPDSKQQNCTSGCPEILAGTYPFKWDLFPHNLHRQNQQRYPALYLGEVPSKAPNPNNDDKTSITGVWIHHGIDGAGRSGSEGCLTIDPKYWDAFMKNFPKRLNRQCRYLVTEDEGTSMKIRKVWPVVIVVALVSASDFAAANGAAHTPPRSIDGIRLGMPVDEFQKLTGIKAAHCVHCVEQELQADLYLDPQLAAHMRQKPAQLRDPKILYQSPDLRPEHVVCFFYKGKLYNIVLNDVKDTIAAVRNRYEAALGQPAGMENWDTGYSQVRWENKTTTLEVVFETKETGIDHLTIDYVDRKISSSIPREPGKE